MTPKSMRDIPTKTWIEQQILASSFRNGLLTEAVHRIEDEYGLPKGALGNGLFFETRMLSLLYLLLVFPREQWRRENRTEEIERFLDWSIDRLPESSFTGEKPSSTLHFIRRIRNAVAHANIEVSNDAIEFWDAVPGKQESFRVRMSLEQIEVFLQEIGKLFANRRHHAI